ncbi:hypothetical protein [Holospora undulata]|uniref:Uncharacterized protein n=1 Tax=Holospora undulata HU1 TaxID=1321371 RepID=A0A061JHF8_9PROT|nr:hypothetical protein [Holospora undulata]ETZ04728.1 hypothetical protein K737_300854 [Holospora undulata HU1]
MFKTEQKSNSKKSDLNQPNLSAFLVQQYENLLFSLYSPGIFRGLWCFLKMFIVAIIAMVVFWFSFAFYIHKLVFYISNFLYSSTCSFVSKAFADGPIFDLISHKFYLLIGTGCFFFILKWIGWIDEKIFKNDWLKRFFYLSSLISTKALLYIIPPMVASSAVGAGGFFIIKAKLEQKITLMLILGSVVFIPLMCLSFWLYKPLFLKNKGIEFSPSLKNELSQELDKMQNYALKTFWINSFFYVLLNEIIFYLVFLPYGLALSFVIKILFSFDKYPSYYPYVLTLLPCIAALVFFIPFLIQRYYPKGIVFFIHKLSCAQIVTFLFCFNCFGLAKEVFKFWNWILFDITELFRIWDFFTVLDIAFHFLLFYVTVKIYRKFFTRKSSQLI